ncbi:MAG: hypothetical protein JWM78_238 [Verrucomicrobiaceae bacterium]|nr:hypothetical protein [Verrucomicrobiaceae bacterium]
MSESKTYRTFNEFYSFYLSEHANTVSRRLHFIGTSIVVFLVVTAFVMHIYWLIAVAFVQAYAFAWIGHFFFEHNKPATFNYPLFSLLGDWRMWWEVLTGKVRL